MKNKKIKRKSPQNETTLDKTLKSTLWSLLITACISIALLLLGTAAAYFTSDPTAFVDPVGYVAMGLSAFLGGFAASKLNKRAPYLTSVLTGAGFVLLSMLLSFVLPHSLASGMDIWTRLALHALSLAIFPLGALTGVKSASKPKHKRLRR